MIIEKISLPLHPKNQTENMQAINRLKLVLVKQKLGGIHDVNIIVEGAPSKWLSEELGIILPQLVNGVLTLYSQTSELLQRSQHN